MSVNVNCVLLDSKMLFFVDFRYEKNIFCTFKNTHLQIEIQIH
jgi:hypothetical protein